MQRLTNTTVSHVQVKNGYFYVELEALNSETWPVQNIHQNLNFKAEKEVKQIADKSYKNFQCLQIVKNNVHSFRKGDGDGKIGTSAVIRACWFRIMYGNFEIVVGGIVHRESQKYSGTVRLAP